MPAWYEFVLNTAFYTIQPFYYVGYTDENGKACGPGIAYNLDG